MKKVVNKKKISVEMLQDTYKQFLRWQNSFEVPTKEDVRDIKKAEKDFAEGRYVTHDQLYKKLFGKSPDYASL